MAKDGKAAGAAVKKPMHKKQQGMFKSGESAQKVTSRKQVIAISLSAVRDQGARVARKKK